MAGGAVGAAAAGAALAGSVVVCGDVGRREGLTSATGPVLALPLPLPLPPARLARRCGGAAGVTTALMTFLFGAGKGPGVGSLGWGAAQRRTIAIRSQHRSLKIKRPRKYMKKAA